MNTLAQIHFDTTGLPHGWIEQEQQATYTEQGMRTNGGSVLYSILKDARCERAAIEIAFTAIDGAHLTFHDGSLAIVADLTKGSLRAIHGGLNVVATAMCDRIQPGATGQLTFLNDRGRLSVILDGKELLSTHAALFTGFTDLGFWDDMVVQSIVVSGEKAKTSHPYPARPETSQLFEITVDFYDDLLRAPWTAEMFDSLFATFARWGVHRCQWIYYGKDSEAFLPGHIPVRANYLQTIRNVGEILPAAVQAAQRHGIALDALIKPFDFGLNYSFGEGSDHARTLGKLPRIGGPVGWISRFVAENRDCLMARKPGACGPAKHEIFTRIDLVKEDDKAPNLGLEAIELYVSDDNITYHPYSGPITRQELLTEVPVWEHTASGGRCTGEKRRAHVWRLTGLSIRENYFAIKAPDASFANTLINLIHVYHGDEREMLLTYGLHVRPGAIKLDSRLLFESVAPDFRKTGVEFDVLPNFPTACCPGYNALSSRFPLTGSEGFIAFARGKERTPVAALSPSHPKARAWWLGLVEECLDAGVDGVELRVRNHHSPLSWSEYGFEEPVRERYLELTGVDLWTTDDFDKTVWRKIRGEAYTRFCHEARALVHARGKQFGLHLSPTLDMHPSLGGAMEIHFNWPEWVRDGLADRFTLKEIWPRTALSEAILSLTRSRNIPVIFSPYANNIWSRPSGEKLCQFWMTAAQEFDYDGYQFYEAAAILKATPEGTLKVEPKAVDALFSYVARTKTLSA